MAAAKLTRGGFYKHFDSKEALYVEAITQFNCRDTEAWQRAHVDAAAEGPQLLRMIVSAYLSKEHFDDRDGSCPMIGLPSDAARAGGTIKAAYRQVLQRMAQVFETSLPTGEPSTRERALTLVALCVGSMVLSRAVDDEGLAEDLRNAARRHVLSVSGWGRARD
jgi:TetR/AcrR family transcriptional regulator, transcriptional repressor for nem operon